ncbi:formate-dependent phosphoribosylglycinamide formyltransferase [Congregibacter brevis]|uniref:Formate-dependent phosphoribosylglycinamide formyltransferase n=1 Tax=Congregibacter brevis TaxID=3081201 RepID=A0ABZ0IFJ8_9GAMM|nr:formate-dependent phosphoribosylglycinamide formyltransferase [Congregibacter sp. IMCC45268]
MPTIGTPFTASATRALLCGAGELGKEVAIELQRLGIEVIACDRYADAPAMQVADRSYVFPMLDGERLRAVIEMERPAFIVPEIEAIDTSTLVELENEGFNVVPSARAAQLTMNREGIRRLVAESLDIRTSPYRFADTPAAFAKAIDEIGMPCVVKPIMSSSGKGQSVVRGVQDIQKSWEIGQEGGRAGAGRLIVEGFVDFDYEITLLTVQHISGVSFCAPIGHRQEDGDYRESWQPHPMDPDVLKECEDIAARVTAALGGNGLFGVEFFISGKDVYFSEVSPRPHDTGMVTLISQDLSEFALHVRAFLGLPIPGIQLHGPSASAVILPEGDSENIQYGNLASALSQVDTDLRLFGKPTIAGRRRMGVALARGTDIDNARVKARTAAAAVNVRL